MKFSRRKILILIILLLLISGAIFFYFISSANEVPVVEEIQSTEESSDSQVSPNDTPGDATPQTEPTKPEVTEEPIVGTASVTLSFVEQQDSNIVARAFAESDSSGSCELKLTKGSQTIVKTSESSLQTSYYQCSGFEFSINDMPSDGLWTAAVTYTDGSGARNISNEVEFEVTK